MSIDPLPSSHMARKRHVPKMWTVDLRKRAANSRVLGPLAYLIPHTHGHERRHTCAIREVRRCSSGRGKEMGLRERNAPQAIF